jgi:hypothetical protein
MARCSFYSRGLKILIENSNILVVVSCHTMLHTGPAFTQTLGGKYGKLHRFIRVTISSINMISLEKKEKETKIKSFL